VKVLPNMENICEKKEYTSSPDIHFKWGREWGRGGVVIDFTAQMPTKCRPME